MKKYLRIKIVGHDYMSAFMNEKKTDEKHPDYVGDGVAVWIREFLEKPKVEEVKDVEL